MNDHRKWPLISIVSLGIGISTIFIAGRSIARVALRWRFLRKVNVIQKRLKEKLENPFPATTIVTRISEWDEVCSVLLRYNMQCLFSNAMIFFSFSYLKAYT